MSLNNRVFITGLGALTATGTTADDSWNAVLAGQSGIRNIQQWDLSDWPVHIGGELKEFKPAKMLPDRKLFKVISLQDVMGINAAVQAIHHSGLISYRDALDDAESFNEQTAIYVGSPGNKYYQQYDFLPLLSKSNDDMKVFAQELFTEVHPMWLLRILPNNVLAYTGITYGFKGPNHNITNHAIGGAQAVLEAFHAIQTGQVERAVVVAYDMGVEPQALFYYEKLGVLSTTDLKPFEHAHDGTVLADGAAALILESEKSATARNATCHGEIIGGLSATETAGLFAVEKEGKPLADLMRQTLMQCQLDAKEIGMLVTHGNGNPKSDDTEASAVQAVFPSETPVTAFKWSTGHTLCASGLLDTVLATYALKQQCIPGIANFKQPANSSKDLAISTSHQSLNRSHALIINRGFGSMNACLVIKACE
ncbi:beta-ketoacyl-[acyl-carrier-protein] synthase family protein [Legionella israelensis]|uniref:Ketosynthase family 3 (KS3) domain-containing protein n=1 Tax=Legionella israelensis TaxID=454 RepID=A0A0W0WGQ0_9GAMM|nr:beta-ketoacyl synthase N-terminal-like domain-containing protein [Legionella israelensis]KTD31512.1 hypothetical protein Lisr_0595 [Legionella israelensis]QBS09481.1 3-oxoacyl-ACP synthase [Legionella israelensis]SCX96326.1 3-oxoacyl-[acyl-carrier-protein] synthase-1 [Legionella israelensis DSM 19235]STX60389.1 3-oxoacyl-ACP synthase [Legionella israelensis]